MNNGLKLSKPGHSVTNEVASNAVVERHQKKIVPHLLYGIAISYFHGAKLQLERYSVAYKTEHPLAKAHLCMHEISGLFEDLTTAAKYAQMCGDSHELHKLWLDVRNHSLQGRTSQRKIIALMSITTYFS